MICTTDLIGRSMAVYRRRVTIEGCEEVCPAMAEVRSDPGKEAEYMTWQTKMMDIEYKAKEEGRKEERKEEREIGLRVLIETLHALSQSREAIEQIVVDKFHLSPSVAKEKVAQYWS